LITGVDSNTTHADRALELKIVDQITNFSNSLENCDLVVLAVPVDSILKLLPQVLEAIDTKTTVMDLGSTKALISKSVNCSTKRSNYVAAHPMAGTEFSGPDAAFSNLYDGKIAVICDKELSGETHLKTVTSLLEEIGMNLLFYDSESHDRHLAYVSHLSHVSSYALGVTVLKKETDEEAIFDMASTGFSSTVRLAKSSPQTWEPIFKQNKDNLGIALKNYIEELQEFEAFIRNEQWDKASDWMRFANDIKRVLSGIGFNKK
jgi:prephenate dehydrogenase